MRCCCAAKPPADPDTGEPAVGTQSAPTPNGTADAARAGSPAPTARFAAVPETVVSPPTPTPPAIVIAEPEPAGSSSPPSVRSARGSDPAHASVASPGSAKSGSAKSSPRAPSPRAPSPLAASQPSSPRQPASTAPTQPAHSTHASPTFSWSLTPLTSPHHIAAGPPKRGSSAFAGAGTHPGLEIWRVDKPSPLLLAPRLHGKFDPRGGYVLLKTAQQYSSSALASEVYVWLGDAASEPAKGAATQRALELADSLGARAAVTVWREAQWHESARFLGLFRTSGGVEYLGPTVLAAAVAAEEAGAAAKPRGGAKQGAAHVNRLLRVEGERVAIVREVPCNVRSLLPGVCDTPCRLCCAHVPG